MSTSLTPTSTRIMGRYPWLALATVAAAQFMLVVDAFIVNVAIPSIRAGLDASPAEIDAVITVYMISYATLLIIGGRLGDIYGRKPIVVLGLLGFTLCSVWCGLAQSGMELVIARLFQGACAALVSPQVLATIHTLFRDAKDRAKAFGIFGVTLGLGGGAAYVLGGALIALNAGGLGWRAVFLVNVPIGAGVAMAATILMPSGPDRLKIRPDAVGAAVLFVGLMCLAVPILAAGDFGWPLWLLPVAVLGIGLLAGFPRLEAWVAARECAPLIDFDLLTDRAFRRGLAAVALLFAGNLSFYLVVMLFLQNGAGLAPFRAGLAMLPLVLAFIFGSRRGARAVAKHGVAALVRGALVMCLGTAACFVAIAAAPGFGALIPALALFGYGQGLVVAPLFGVVLTSVRQANAGAGGGILNTVQQIGNGLGVALLGAIYFAVRAGHSDRAASLAAIGLIGITGLATTALLSRLRPPSVPERP